MAKKQASRQSFNVVIVGQTGRLQYEAVLFAASLRQSCPDFAGRLLVAVPQPGPLWNNDPSIRSAEILAALADLGAGIVPFENRIFGQSYPHGNKIEALSALPEGEPFVFFDTDTLITGDLAGVPFDFDRFAPDPSLVPPLTTLAPSELLGKLVEEYVFAELCEAATLSFAAENEARMRAMIVAHEHVEDRLRQLVAQSHQLRQEEITSEIIELAAGTAARGNAAETASALR